MQFVIFIACLGLKSFSGSPVVAPHASRPHRDRDRDRDRDQASRYADSILMDFYGDILWPQSARRQLYRRTTKRSYSLGSSEEDRYGKTLMYWRGPSASGRWEPYVYDPTAGYEPYWIDGHWVIKSENATTTKGPNCPYADCPVPFINFGPICATDYKTDKFSFETYCDMLLDDCIGGKQLTMAYRGYCDNTQLKLFHKDPKFDIVWEGLWATANQIMGHWLNQSMTTVTWTHYSTKRLSGKVTPPKGPPAAKSAVPAG